MSWPCVTTRCACTYIHVSTLNQTICTYTFCAHVTYTCTHTHAYTYICTCTCTYVHAHVYMHTQIHMYIQTHKRTHACTHIHTSLHVCVCTCTHTTSPTVLDGSAALSRGAIRPDATTVVIPSPSIHAPLSPPSSTWGLTELLSTTPGSFGGGKGGGGGGGGGGGQLLPSMGREKREWVVDPIGPCGPRSDFVSLTTVLEWD